MRAPAENRTYLITGASGYVGGRLVRTLVDEKLDIRIMVRDSNKVKGQPWACRKSQRLRACINWSSYGLLLIALHKFR